MSNFVSSRFIVSVPSRLAFPKATPTQFFDPSPSFSSEYQNCLVRYSRNSRISRLFLSHFYFRSWFVCERKVNFLRTEGSRPLKGLSLFLSLSLPHRMVIRTTSGSKLYDFIFALEDFFASATKKPVNLYSFYFYLLSDYPETKSAR